MQGQYNCETEKKEEEEERTKGRAEFAGAGGASEFPAGSPNFISPGRRRGEFGSVWEGLRKWCWGEGRSLSRVKASKLVY